MRKHGSIVLKHESIMRKHGGIMLTQESIMLKHGSVGLILYTQAIFIHFPSGK
jgi:hypothetical protein